MYKKNDYTVFVVKKMWISEEKEYTFIAIYTMQWLICMLWLAFAQICDKNISDTFVCCSSAKNEVTFVSDNV